MTGDADKGNKTRAGLAAIQSALADLPMYGKE